MSELILEVKNLVKIYGENMPVNNRSFKDVFSPTPEFLGENGEVVALNLISFNLKRGESLGVIGPNGAGKSTLLKVLSGITKPSGGEVKIYGNTLSILDIGVGFHPDLTGKENVFLSGEILGMTKKQIKDKYNEIVDFSGIGQFVNKPVKYYSSGMYLRLAFSIVVNLEADLLLFDEMLSVGDQDFKLKSLNKLYELEENGRSFILVSHNMQEIANMCNVVIMMEEGKIIRQGKVYDVLKYYTGLKSKKEEEVENEKQETEKPSKEPDEDKYIKVINIKTFGTDNVVKSSFRRNEEIRVEIDYEQLTDEPIDLGFAVRDMLETWLFGGATAMLDDFEGGKGKYKMSCLIAANLLNSGRFTIQIVMLKDGKIVQRLLDMNEFEIEGEGIIFSGQSFYVPLNPDLQVRIEKMK